MSDAIPYDPPEGRFDPSDKWALFTTDEVRLILAALAALTSCGYECAGIRSLIAESNDETLRRLAAR